MIEDINSDAIEVNLDNLILPARLYRIVENDPAAEKRKQAFLERWGVFTINANASGTQQPNGIADAAAKVRVPNFFFDQQQLICICDHLFLYYLLNLILLIGRGCSRVMLVWRSGGNNFAIVAISAARLLWYILFWYVE